MEGFDQQFVGREEIKEIEEIAQRSKVKGSENDIEAGLDRARSTARSTGGQSPVDWRAQRAQTWPSRPTDAFCSPFWIRTPFLFWSRIQSGFPKSLGFSGYKYGLKPSCIVPLKFLEVSLWYSLILIVESVKSLSLLPQGRRQIVEPR